MAELLLLIFIVITAIMAMYFAFMFKDTSKTETEFLNYKTNVRLTQLKNEVYLLEQRIKALEAANNISKKEDEKDD